jgi:hypothetical protein
MNTPKSPGAVVALGASVVDQLGRQVIPEINRRQQLPQAAIRTAGAGDRAVMAASNGGPSGARPSLQERKQEPAHPNSGPLTSSLLAKFAAARRRQWPGAMIALRPDSMIATEVVNSGPTRGEPRKDGSVRRTNLGNCKILCAAIAASGAHFISGGRTGEYKWLKQ